MIKSSVANQPSQIISHNTIANVVQHTGTSQKSLVAGVSFAAGDDICKFSAGIIQSFATNLTVQTGAERHITLVPEFLQYINHSCFPTVFFNTTSMELVCLKPMQPGDELTFFYPSTEWKMAQPFVCNCGNPECLQLINGASQLSVQTLSKYKLTDFIRQQLKEKLSL